MKEKTHLGRLLAGPLAHWLAGFTRADEALLVFPLEDYVW